MYYRYNAEKRESCSLDLAMKLKEIGIRQDRNQKFWSVHNPKKIGLSGHPEFMLDCNVYKTYLLKKDSYYSAFTIGELGAMLDGWVVLQDRLGMWRVFQPKGNDWTKVTTESDGTRIQFMTNDICQTEADARAWTLLFKIENGYTTVDDINGILDKQ